MSPPQTVQVDKRKRGREIHALQSSASKQLVKTECIHSAAVVSQNKAVFKRENESQFMQKRTQLECEGSRNEERAVCFLWAELVFLPNWIVSKPVFRPWKLMEQRSRYQNLGSPCPIHFNEDFLSWLPKQSALPQKASLLYFDLSLVIERPGMALVLISFLKPGSQQCVQSYTAASSYEILKPFQSGRGNF